MHIARRALRAHLLILAAAATLGGARAEEPVSRAADMSVRDITSALFKSSPDAPVDLSKKNLAELDLSGLDFKGAKLAGSEPLWRRPDARQPQRRRSGAHAPRPSVAHPC